MMINTLRPSLLAALVLALAGPMPAVGADEARFDGLRWDAPSNVAELIGRGLECRYWSDEKIVNAVIDAEAIVALIDLKCDALDADAAALRVSYVEALRTLRALAAGWDIAPWHQAQR